ELFKKIDWYGCDGRGFVATIDHDDTRPRDGEKDGGGLRRRDRDVRAQAAVGRLAPQLVANRPRRAEQPLEAADVDDYPIPPRFVPGGKLLCNSDKAVTINREARHARRDSVFTAIVAFAAVHVGSRRI